MDDDTVLSPGEEKRSTRLCLIGIIGGTAVTYELPPHGKVVIGRAPDADVRIDHASISRRHVVIHMSIAPQVEDLGSSNGTWVREQRIAPNVRTDISPGEALRVGSVTLVMQTRMPTQRIRAFWTHGYFEARVSEECARAEATGGELAVLRVHVDAEANSVVQEAFGAVLSSADVAGIYAPGELEALLVPMPDRDPDEVARRIVDILADAGVEATAGVARYPADGRNAYVLLNRAGALAAGTGRDAATTTALPRGADVIEPSPAMRDVFALCAQVAKGEINVLVLGETGVGKEVMAERIHNLSPRAAKPLLKLNCATLSESLLESELFGHERGAFTGADRQKQGLLETAQGGTVFLDEIGEMPIGLQAKLLRVIDDRKLIRIGGLKPLSIDVRFVAATNRDLEVEIANHRFREDLYYRLNGVSLQIPPLRQRREEIPALVHHFIATTSRRQPPPQISRQALELLQQYAWPGNIRELRNVIERAVLLCGDAPIAPEHLPLEKMRATFEPAASRRRAAPTPVVAESASAFDTTPIPTPGSLRDQLDAIERERIEEALRVCGGNQSAAAKMLGMPRPTFLKRLDAYGITRPRKR